MHDEAIITHLNDALRGVPVWAYRLWLDTGGVAADLPELRGCWGKCLADLDPYVFRAVFRVQEGDDNQASPRFVLRWAATESAGQTVIDLICLGSAVRHTPLLLQAWFDAAAFGIRTTSGKRMPFSISRIAGLRADGTLCDTPEACAPFDLHSAPTADGEGLLGTCGGRLVFGGTTKIVRPKSDYLQARRADSPLPPATGRSEPVRPSTMTSFYEELTLGIVIRAILARLKQTHLEPHAIPWKALIQAAVERADRLPSWWQGQRHDLAKAHKPVRIQGIRGELTIPGGCGPFAGILAAGSWLHVGRDYVEGCGGYRIETNSTDLQRCP